MVDKLKSIILCAVSLAFVVGCGFKSELYLPGQPQNLEQHSSKSLRDLGDKKLQQLKNQTEDVTRVSQEVTGDGSLSNESTNGTTQKELLDGFLVEVPDEKELGHEKSNPRKITVESDRPQ